MKLLAALFATLSISSAQPATNYGQPLLTECSPDVIRPVAVVIREPEEIVELHESLFGKAPENLVAFWFTQNGINVLVVPPLRGQLDQWRMHVWGHELAHAVCGTWHDEKGAR